MIRRVRPVWPCPRNIRAFTTTRAGGVSRGPWASFNLGAACGDDPAAVRENRARFRLPLPGAPGWLRQVHSATVVARETLADDAEPPEADAAVCRTVRLPCTVLTADCVPVLFCDRRGTRVAAAHAGWRGLVAGVLQATVADLATDPAELLAWLGPAIGPDAYEVGEDLREHMLAAFPDAGPAFHRAHGGLHLDLYAVARLALQGAGVESVYGGNYCTHADAERFYSYRRDGNTGRMASVIWIHEPAPEPGEGGAEQGAAVNAAAGDPGSEEE